MIRHPFIIAIIFTWGSVVRPQNSTEFPPANITNVDDNTMLNSTSNPTAAPTLNTNNTDIMMNSTVGNTTNSTDPSEPNECRRLEPGAIQVVMVNSDPVDQITLFPLTTIGVGVGKLYVTDIAWDGNSTFITDEGTLEYTIGEGGLAAGKAFGYGLTFPDDKGTWKYTGSFDLSTSIPDNMLLYCLDEYEEPHFLLALTYNGNFSDPNLYEYTSSETALPQNILDADYGSLALPFFPNYLYQGRNDGTEEQLLEAFKDPANYAGSFTPYEFDLEGTSGVISLLLFQSVVALNLVVILCSLLF